MWGETLQSKADEDVDILLVEDNPGDARLLAEALESAGIEHALHVVSDGKAALDFTAQRNEYDDAPRPHLIFLDLNLPGMSGTTVLEGLKTDPERQHIPVIVLTSSDDPSDVQRAYELGANAYITKPVNPDTFVGVVESLGEFWLAAARLPSH